MKVGILGGTFDPVHVGHLALAEAALWHFGLDLVLFVPASQPWRKTREITSAEHRLAMLRLALAGKERFAISDVELRRSGPTYTADTLDDLAGERLDDEFWFIAGADALADLPNWKDPERIARHAILAAAPRNGADIERAIAAVPALAGRIEPFPLSRIDVSSTEIRRRVAASEPIDTLVPPGVAAYITQHGLYR
ncbi:MAG: nicotinate-nucleotide adenylyltransferase [Chloroflexi bacterium]|nr:nicotinate-nucleotide adenylyltransferase [Chloroflexota bacterium]